MMIKIYALLLVFQAFSAKANSIKPQIIDLGALEAVDEVRFGGESSGGGSAIVCRDSNNQVTSVEMLDLFEGEILYGLNFVEDTRPYRDQVEDFINQLSYDRGFVIDMKKAVREIYQDMVFLPKGVIIHTPGDLGKDEAVILPNGCEISGVGFYEKKSKSKDSATLRISTDYFNLMSEFQKTAFIIHEALYSIYRFHFSKGTDINKTSSAKETRVFTAHLLAESSSWKLNEIDTPFRWSPVPNVGSFASPLYYNKNLNIKLRFTSTGLHTYAMIINAGCSGSADLASYYQSKLPYSTEVKLEPGQVVELRIGGACPVLHIESGNRHWYKTVNVEILDQNNNLIRALNKDDHSGKWGYFLTLPLYPVETL